MKRGPGRAVTVSLLEALRAKPARGPVVARKIAHVVDVLGAPLEQVAEHYSTPVSEIAHLACLGRGALTDAELLEWFAAWRPSKEEVTPGQYSREDVRAIFERHGFPAWNFIKIENPTTGELEPLSDLSLTGRYKIRRADGTWRNPSKVGGPYVPGARAHEGRPLADHVIREVLRLYSEGEPLRVIWSRTAVPPGQVLAFAKKAGVFVERPRGKRKKPRAA